jgi:hypothetical protein
VFSRPFPPCGLAQNVFPLNVSPLKCTLNLQEFKQGGQEAAAVREEQTCSPRMPPQKENVRDVPLSNAHVQPTRVCVSKLRAACTRLCRHSVQFLTPAYYSRIPPPLTPLPPHISPPLRQMESLQDKITRLREENTTLKGRLNRFGSEMNRVRQAALEKFPDFVSAMAWPQWDFSYDLAATSACGSDSVGASSAGSPTRQPNQRRTSTADEDLSP